jgi:NAD(P)-dependent dehydrogenase (short-subunit alcohol dehydrogenase family)
MTERRIAVVTGGALGIGQATAVRLARDGFDIAIADLEPAVETAAKIEALGRRVFTQACDLSDPEAAEGFARTVLGRLGRCDVLFNNAGMYAFVPLEELTYDVWRRYLSLNLDAAFVIARAFALDMKTRGWGRIINIASNSFTLHVPNMAQYIASKGGVVGLTRGLASDLGDFGITVNAVAPGPTLTEGVRRSFIKMHGSEDEAALDAFLAGVTQSQAIKRIGRPEDVAAAVSFLASEEAGFITAQTLVIDGGQARH